MDLQQHIILHISTTEINILFNMVRNINQIW